jgi:hypothetical protein
MKIDSANTTVLMVDSVDDAITRRRHSFLASSELLQGITLQYCYAIELSEPDKADLDLGIGPDFQLTKNMLFGRVDRAIRSFHPDYVMVHSGFVYRRYPQVYRGAFAQLKHSHPDVRIGLQLRPGIEIDPIAFDTDPAVREIHDLIFVHALG